MGCSSHALGPCHSKKHHRLAVAGPREAPLTPKPELPNHDTRYRIHTAYEHSRISNRLAIRLLVRIWISLLLKRCVVRVGVEDMATFHAHRARNQHAKLMRPIIRDSWPQACTQPRYQEAQGAALGPSTAKRRRQRPPLLAAIVDIAICNAII